MLTITGCALKTNAFRKKFFQHSSLPPGQQSLKKDPDLVKVE